MMIQEPISKLDTVKISDNLILDPDDNQRLASLCGQFHEHIKIIEEHFDVKISNRGNSFHISGTKNHVNQSAKTLQDLYHLTGQHKNLTKAEIHLALQENINHTPIEKKPGDKIRTKTCVVLPKGQNQQRYVKNIQTHDINFAIGPAGTGKTFLAVACAVAALETHRVNRIVLVRPAVEAGEHLGFLPGDLVQKVDPYLRPLYDALYETLGLDHVTKLIEKNIIEIAPLAFMRGRTLNESFIILDEGQNATPAQMKMFLTRIGFSSVAVITGDITQIDLPKNNRSGLVHATQVLDGINGISFNHFTSKDVVRHPLVQRIIDAYERDQ